MSAMADIVTAVEETLDLEGYDAAGACLSVLTELPVDIADTITVSWLAEQIGYWLADHEHHAASRCPHGRTAASRTANPCPPGLPGCVIP